MARHLLPRQTTLTSLLTSLSSDINTQSSSVTPRTSSSSSTPSSTTQTPQVTDTSSSTETSSSTSQSTPATPASDHTTSSHTTPSSSSSSTPSDTTSSPTSSSPVPPPSTTQPPPSSSSLHGTPTTITSSYTVYVNGSPSVISTTIPTTISESTTSSSSERSAIIGGSAAGGAALIIIILAFAFCARRKRFKQLDFLDRITRKQNQAYTRANLLDGEDDDVDLARPPLAAQPLRGYTSYETPWDPPTGAGSAFTGTRTPPHEHARLINTLSTARPDEAETDLGRIVDDVMGPPAYATVEAEARHHFSAQSVSSMYRGSMAETDGQVHSRTVSNASNAALLEAAGMGGTGAVRSSPLAQPGLRRDGGAS